MVKRIDCDGLLAYEPRRGCRLTKKGERQAAKILRKHRIIESYLVDVLRMDWADVHIEAERLEHAVSDRLLEYIERQLDNPIADPHGGVIPLPGRTGAANLSGQSALGECDSGVRVKMMSVDDSDAGLLKKLGNHGIYPGSVLEVTDSSESTATVTVRVSGYEALTISRDVANSVRVNLL